MTTYASFTGVLKMILMIVGVFVVLRFVGQVMQAKSNLKAQEDMKERERQQKLAREQARKNIGKTSILSGGSNRQAEDVDFEEM